MLIIGLGNPGRKHDDTRHNAGVMFVDYLGKRLGNFKTLASDEFMNNSGRFVRRALAYYKLRTTNLLIAHDDLDMRIGEYKIQKGRGPKDHNGIKSIEEELGTDDFWRIRIGVDNRDPDKRIEGDKYVLQKFAKEELDIIEGVFEEILNELTERQDRF